MAIIKKSVHKKNETKIVPDDKDGTLPYVSEQKTQDAFASVLDKEEGQLAVDVFQTGDEIVIVAPVAGVSLADLSITVEGEVLSINGRRSLQFNVSPTDYFTQECFWGDFSRSVILPQHTDAGRVKASFKNGILTVRIPKIEHVRMRTIAIREE